MNFFVRYPQCKPLCHLQRLQKGDLFQWLATDNDPQFTLPKARLLPGWQMLEVAIDHDQPSAAVKLYFNRGEGVEEEASVYLPLKSGRITKRLFWMPFGVKTLRLNPLESEEIGRAHV